MALLLAMKTTQRKQMVIPTISKMNILSLLTKYPRIETQKQDVWKMRVPRYTGTYYRAILKMKKAPVPVTQRQKKVHFEAHGNSFTGFLFKQTM